LQDKSGAQVPDGYRGSTCRYTFLCVWVVCRGWVTALLFMGVAVLFSSSYNGVAAALIQYLVKPDMRALAGGLYLFVISIAGFGLGPPFAGWLMDTVYAGDFAVSKALITVIVSCGTIGTVCFIQAMKSYDADKE
jgi:MFS family permease